MSILQLKTEMCGGLDLQFFFSPGCTLHMLITLSMELVHIRWMMITEIMMMMMAVHISRDSHNNYTCNIFEAPVPRYCPFSSSHMNLLD